MVTRNHGKENVRKIGKGEAHRKCKTPQLGERQVYTAAVAYPGILFGEGVQQIQLRTEDRENGDLGAAAP